jgi:2',3'-cyclic-nucleotide 2'-phosphodiesterase (5'-nucleotidase family)
VPYLKDAAKQQGLRFVTTNALNEKGEPIFDPYLIVERAGRKVAFLAVVSPARTVTAQVEAELIDKKIKLIDPTEAVRKYLPELRKNADLVVLLAHTGIETAQFLADDLGVDVVVAGHYPAILNEPEKHKRTLLVMSGSKSERFGTLDLTLGTDGSLNDVKMDTIALTKDGPTVAAIQGLFDELDGKQKEARKEQQLAAQRAREAEQQQQAVAAVHERGGIMGAESCRTCHQNVYDAWLRRPRHRILHARGSRRLGRSE